jgi:hypothetical protein
VDRTFRTQVALKNTHFSVKHNDGYHLGDINVHGINIKMGL